MRKRMNDSENGKEWERENEWIREWNEWEREWMNQRMDMNEKENDELEYGNECEKENEWIKEWKWMRDERRK